MFARFEHYKNRIPFTNRQTECIKNQETKTTTTTTTTTTIKSVKKVVEEKREDWKKPKLVSDSASDHPDETTQAYKFVDAFEKCEQYALLIE